MPYVELKKLHYIDSEEYAKEYLSRFASEEAVKLDFYIKEKHCTRAGYLSAEAKPETTAIACARSSVSPL